MEEIQMDKITDVNGKKKFIRLAKIKISPEFKETLPRVGNLSEKYSYYKRYKCFKSDIVVNKHYVLVDGYITYLLAKMLGIKKIHVVVTN